MKRKLLSVMSIVLALTVILSTFAGLTANADNGDVYIPEEGMVISEAVYDGKAVKLYFDFFDGVVLSEEDADGVYVYRSATGKKGTWKKIATSKSTETFADTTVVPNKTYWYTFKAYGNVKLDGKKQKYVQESENKVSVSTQIERPEFTFAGNSGEGVLLKWAKDKNLSGAVIYRSATGKAGSWTKIKTVKGNKTVSYTDSNVDVNETYYYCIKVYKTVNGKNYYSQSSKAYKKVITDVAVPDNLYVTPTSEGMKVTYSKVPATKGYIIYRSLSGEKGTWKKICTTKSNNTLSFLDTDVVNGVEYFYTVKSYKILKGKTIASKSAAAFCEKSTKGEIAINLSVAEVSFSELLEKQTVRVYVDGAPKYDSLKFEIADPKVATGTWMKIDENTSDIILTRVGPGETTLRVYYDNYPDSAVTINITAFKLDLDDDYREVQELVAEAYEKFSEVLDLLKKLQNEKLSDLERAEIVKQVKDKVSEASVLLGKAAELAQKYADYSTDSESIANLQKFVDIISKILNDWVGDDAMSGSTIQMLMGYLNQILKSAGIK